MMEAGMAMEARVAPVEAAATMKATTAVGGAAVEAAAPMTAASAAMPGGKPDRSPPEHEREHQS